MTVRGNALRPRVHMAALMVLSTSIAFGQPAVWTIEVVGQGAWPTVAVDEALRTHVCYSHPATTLVHAYRDNDGWHASTVDQAASGEIWDKSMVRENDGTLHVAYLGGRLSPYDFIGYAHHDIDGWHAEHFQTTYPVWGPALAMDSEQRPHVVYPIMLGMNVLRHAWKDATAWSYESIGGILSTGDIAIDSEGRVHVAFFQQTSDEYMVLLYGVKGDSGWTFDMIEVDLLDVGVRGPSLCIDASSSSHISYVRTHDEVLRYASNASGSWVIETVGPAGSDESISSLCVSAGGTTSIAHWNAGASVLEYAVCATSGWTVVSVDSIAEGIQDLHLVLDAYGNPHIAYDDTANGVVRLARAGIPLIVNDYETFYELSWGPIGGTLVYWVYGAANAAYFVPGLDPPYDHRIAVLGAANSTWTTTLGLDAEDNFTFRVIAFDANSHEIARSPATGEFDFLTGLP